MNVEKSLGNPHVRVYRMDMSVQTHIYQLEGHTTNIIAVEYMYRFVGSSILFLKLELLNWSDLGSRSCQMIADRLTFTFMNIA